MLKPLVRRAALTALILAAPVVTVAQERLAPGALPAGDRPFGKVRENDEPNASMRIPWLPRT